MIGAAVRRLLWRLVFALTGGLTVQGIRPPAGCVVVANHSSHADAPALLAALPARSRAVVAAAADYWFSHGPRGRTARWLVNAIAIRRGSGGYRDLAAAVPHLRTGGTVVVFPEGTRTRDGELGAFRSGAARLTAEAGVPLVPVTLSGTRAMLPVHGEFRRGPIGVRVGAPVACIDAARTAIAGNLRAPAPRVDSALRRRVARLAYSPLGVAVVLAWGFAESISWPLLPELLLAILVVAAPRRAAVLSLAAACASVAGGMLAWQLAAAGVAAPEPLTSPAMRATANAQLWLDGAAAVCHQPLSGIPYKVYAAGAGRAGVDPVAFAAWSVVARGGRILAVGLGLGIFARVLVRANRFYPLYLAGLFCGFAAGLAAVITSWN